MRTLRLSLTLSGAVALGAYEGGALAALLYAVRPLCGGRQPAVRIDVMSGASAGSITALLAARTLQQGHDPRAVMSGAWVERDSIGALLAHGDQAPLSIESLRATARGLLDPDGDTPSSERQALPISLSYTLACLRGLEYRLPRLGREPVQATTSVDYYDHELAADADTSVLVEPAGASPLDAVLASAANAMGFPPYLLDRSRQWADYERHGVDNLPPDPDRSLWYTDGGTLDNEPLGRTLDLTNRADTDADAGCQRLHLLIHPHPTAAVRDLEWADPAEPPTFVQTAVRALNLQRTQSLYADLKQVEKTNTHLRWVSGLCDALGPALDRLPDAEREPVVTALTDAVAAMRKDQRDLRHQRGGRGRRRPASRPSGPASQLLGDALALAAGVAGKHPARVDVLSPLLLKDSATHSVEQMLSGEVLFHFGGFLDENLRRNDFDLGYSTTLAWLASGALTDAGLPRDLAAQATEAAQTAYRPGDGWRRTGDTTVGSLLRMHPWQAARLVGKVTQVLLHDFVHRQAPGSGA